MRARRLEWVGVAAVHPEATVLGMAGAVQPTASSERANSPMGLRRSYTRLECSNSQAVGRSKGARTGPLSAGSSRCTRCWHSASGT